MILFLLFTLTPFQADKLEIFKEDNERIVHLIGNVIIEGDETKIMCAEAKISEAHGWVWLSQNVKILNRNGEVTASSAVYYFNEDRGYLSDSVTIVTQDEKIRSDSLYYDGMTDSVEMYGNVVIEDNRNNLIAHGERGWYNLAKDEGLLMDDPHLEVARQGKTPMMVYANAFKLHTNDNLFYGFGSVRAIIDSVVVNCDTFSYDLQKESGEMVRPVIQEGESELRGAHGRFTLKNKEMEFMNIRNGQSVYYTEGGSRNFVEGENISITFRLGRAAMITVEGQPNGVLWLRRSQENAGD